MRVEGLSKSFGGMPALDKRVRTLSKGFKRRLLLALALLCPRPVLVLDEPFDGLDLRQSLGVMALLRSERSRGRTLVLSIHQLTDAEEICDRLLLMSAERVDVSTRRMLLRRGGGRTSIA